MQAAVDAIGHLDFEPVIPCEHSDHENVSQDPASFFVRAWCNNPEGCEHGGMYFICRPCWNSLLDDDVECNDCGFEEPRNDCMKIIDIVRGY